MAHKLPPLRFGYDALEPSIDAETMELHHDKHHAAYVDNLNKALEPYPQLAELAVEDCCVASTRCRTRSGPRSEQRRRSRQPSALLGHPWTARGPIAEGAIGDALKRDFGSFEHFQALFTDAATTHFGAGWAFLVMSASRQRLESCRCPTRTACWSTGLRAPLLRCLGARVLPEIPEPPRTTSTPGGRSSPGMWSTSGYAMPW
jgi:Fe-Mn family superoxide dismutase